MGIVNVTPDSFSDGGLSLAPEAAVAHGLALFEQGAGIVDAGGESPLLRTPSGGPHLASLGAVRPPGSVGNSSTTDLDLLQVVDLVVAGGVCRIALVGSLPCNPEGTADDLHRPDSELGELRAAAAAGSVFKDHRLVDHGGVIRRHELTDLEWELLTRSCHRSASPHWQAS